MPAKKKVSAKAKPKPKSKAGAAARKTTAKKGAVALVMAIQEFRKEFSAILDWEMGEPLEGERGEFLLNAFFRNAPADYLAFLREFGALRLSVRLTSGAEFPLLFIYGSAMHDSPLAAPFAAVAYGEIHAPTGMLTPMVRLGGDWLLRDTGGKLLLHTAARESESAFYDDIEIRGSVAKKGVPIEQRLTPYPDSFSEYVIQCLDGLSRKLRDPNVAYWFAPVAAPPPRC